jgi:hypothetical protein
MLVWGTSEGVCAGAAFPIVGKVSATRHPSSVGREVEGEIVNPASLLPLCQEISAMHQSCLACELGTTAA